MKKAIFKDRELQQSFEENGFVKLRLFEPEEVTQLASIRETYFPEKIDYFFSSSYLDDFDRKTEVSEKITELISGPVAKHFENYRLIGAAFLIKGSGPKSEMPMHQDWTIVDEDQYFAVNIWIPLTGTRETNGTIEVLPGSQKWNEALRAPTFPFYFEGHQERIRKHLVAIDAEPGEVVVLNQAVIHYSKANNTDELRPAITAGLISKDAPLTFHYLNPEHPGEVEVFAQDDDFLLRFENFHQSIYQRPQMGTSTGFKPYEIPRLTSEDLDRLLGPEPVEVEEKPGFFARLFGK